MSYDYNSLVSKITSKLFQAASLSSSSSSSSTTTGATTTKTTTEVVAAAAAPSITTNDTNNEQQQQLLALLQESVDLLENLSSHCPMTPLLWMLYADAAGRLVSGSTSSTTTTHENNNNNDYQQTRLDLLQLGLEEFPGSTLLHYHSCRILYHVSIKQIQSTTDNNANDHHHENVEKSLLLLSLLETRIHDAFDQIGVSGEHDLVLALYQLQVQVLILKLKLLKFKQKQNQQRDDENHNYETKRLEIIHLLRQSFISRAQSSLHNHTIGQEINELFNGNDDLLQVNSTTTMWITTLQQQIDQSRRLSAKLFSSTALNTHREQVETALVKEQLLQSRIQCHEYFIHHTDCLQWLVLQSSSSSSQQEEEQQQSEQEEPQQVLPRNGMGFGGVEIAHSYIQYALAIERYKWTSLDGGNSNENEIENEEEGKEKEGKDNDGDDDYDDDLIIRSDAVVWDEIQESICGGNPRIVMSIYERGIADCPTVESLWRSYIRHALEQLLLQEQQEEQPQQRHKNNKKKQQQQQQQQSIFIPDITSLLQRAVKNCPCSLVLAQERLKGPLYMANAGRIIQQQQQHPTCTVGSGGGGVEIIIFDPDTLVDIVQETIDSKFLPGHDNFYALYQTVLMVIKRRILFLLSLQSSSSSSSAAASSKQQQQQQQQCCSYDEAEPVPTKKDINNNKKQNPAALSSRSIMDEQDLQEAVDLCEDLVELYDEIEARLRKSFGSWSLGRSLLWRERCQTEELLIRPLLSCGGNASTSTILRSSTNNSLADSSSNVHLLACEYAEKAVKAHNPPHPDVYLSYIRLFASSGALTNQNPSDVAQRLRQIRFLYSKAVNAVGKSKTKQPQQQSPAQALQQRLRNYEAALSTLCCEWLEFERVFGSERSLGRATKVTQKKLGKAGLLVAPLHQHAAAQQQMMAMTAVVDVPGGATDDIHDIQEEGEEEDSGSTGGSGVKRKLSQDDKDSPPQQHQEGGSTKKQKIETTGTTATTATKSSSPTSHEKTVHKVRVGKLEYPAHPFTVRVSKLSQETVDMDLVDTLRPKCGPVIHARIIREKVHPSHSHQQQHTVGKSKGWGLVQFEERESVEKALALDDVIGLHEKVLKIERSHMPAVTLVPPGLHRVHEKGHGKYSKRNEKHKTIKGGGAAGTISNAAGKAKQQQQQQKEQDQKHPAGEKAQDTESGAGTSVLAFRPRAVAGGRKAHQKPKISLKKT